ncbi:MAG: substrate-binding domain-containing protein [Lachnospiraceae bacterium]|nr:substrate-binding domain-containing protein [Lachnospiraceae bacterium]
MGGYDIAFWLFALAVFILIPVKLIKSGTKPRVIAGKAFILVYITIILLIAYFYILFIAAFTTVDATFYCIIVALAFVLIELTVIFAFFTPVFKKAIKIIVPLFAATILTLGIKIGIEYADSKVPVLSDSNNFVVNEYAPYKDKVATLSGESTFKFKNKVVFDGATALYPVYSAFAKATFGEKDQDYYFKNVTASKTSNAYTNLIYGFADVIFVASPSEKQKALAEENGIKFEFYPIGYEAFVFFVNSKNPLNGLTVDQIKSIYSGETTKWKELGVDKLGNILAYQRNEGSGSQTALLKLMGDTPVKEPISEERVDTMSGIVEQVANYKNYKNALGYSFRFYCTEMLKNNEIKLLDINGISPTVENIRNGSYPITDNFYVVIRSDATSEVREFVKWCTGDQGRELVEKTGYVGMETNKQ